MDILITARDHPGFPECGFPDYNFSLISWLSRLKNQLNIFAGHFVFVADP